MIYYALPFLKIVIFHSKPLKNQSVSFIPRSVALFPLSEALLPLTYLEKKTFSICTYMYILYIQHVILQPKKILGLVKSH